MPDIFEVFPNEVLLNIFDHLDGFFTIRNMSLAMPKVGSLYNKTMHHFVFHYSRYDADRFDRVFSNSISLTHGKEDSIRHFYLGDALPVLTKEEHNAFHPVTIGSYFDAKHDPFGYVDHGYYRREELKDQESIAMEQFKTVIFPKLFDNIIITSWFDEIVEISKNYKFVNFVLDISTQSNHVDLAFILNYLFLQRSNEERFKADFSVSTIKDEQSQAWLFLDNGSVERGYFSLFDHIVDIDIGCSRESKELVLSMVYDIEARFKRLWSPGSEGEGDDEEVEDDSTYNEGECHFPTQYEVELERAIDLILKWNTNPNTSRIHGQLKSFDLILLRDHDRVNHLHECRMSQYFMLHNDVHSDDTKLFINTSSDSSPSRTMGDLSRTQMLISDTIKLRKSTVDILMGELLGQLIESDYLSDEFIDIIPLTNDDSINVDRDIRILNQRTRLYKEIMICLPWMKDKLRDVTIRMPIFRKDDTISHAYQEKRYQAYELSFATRTEQLIGSYVANRRLRSVL